MENPEIMICFHMNNKNVTRILTREYANVLEADRLLTKEMLNETIVSLEAIYAGRGTRVIINLKEVSFLTIDAAPEEEVSTQDPSEVPSGGDAE